MTKTKFDEYATAAERKAYSDGAFDVLHAAKRAFADGNDEFPGTWEYEEIIGSLDGFIEVVSAVAAKQAIIDKLEEIDEGQ